MVRSRASVFGRKQIDCKAKILILMFWKETADLPPALGERTACPGLPAVAGAIVERVPSRAGKGEKFVVARRHDQHARGVCSPIQDARRAEFPSTASPRRSFRRRGFHSWLNPEINVDIRNGCPHKPLLPFKLKTNKERKSS